jgi:hypothetical protein
MRSCCNGREEEVLQDHSGINSADEKKTPDG